MQQAADSGGPPAFLLAWRKRVVQQSVPVSYQRTLIAVSEAVACAAVGAPRDFNPRVAFYSLASGALERALEAVRQDSLTHELLENVCARLESLPPLAAADPLQGLPCA